MDDPHGSARASGGAERGPIGRAAGGAEKGAGLRIGFVGDDMYPGFGGQARASQGHIAALAALGHPVRVLAGAEAEPSETPDGVEVERLPVWRLGRMQTHLAQPRRRAVRALLEWADVVQVNTPTPLGALVAWMGRKRGVPVVMGVHTQIETSSLQFRGAGWLVRWIMHRWYGWVYRQPVCLTAPTRFAADLAAKLTDRPVFPVSNGIALDFAPPALPKQHPPASERSVLYLGRLSAEKRPQDLVEIARHLRSGTCLQVVGEGPMRTRLEAAAASQGLSDRIVFLGLVDEARKHALLAAAEVFVMPSPTELQSIATLEAMAHGCAIFAADYATSAVPTWVRGSGAGTVYAPEDPAEAAHAIDALLDDRPRLLAFQERALQTAATHDVMESGRTLAAIYARLVSQGGQGERERRLQGA